MIFKKSIPLSFIFCCHSFGVSVIAFKAPEEIDPTYISQINNTRFTASIADNLRTTHSDLVFSKLLPEEIPQYIKDIVTEFEPEISEIKPTKVTKKTKKMSLEQYVSFDPKKFYNTDDKSYACVCVFGENNHVNFVIIKRYLDQPFQYDFSIFCYMDLFQIFDSPTHSVIQTQIGQINCHTLEEEEADLLTNIIQQDEEYRSNIPLIDDNLCTRHFTKDWGLNFYKNAHHGLQCRKVSIFNNPNAMHTLLLRFVRSDQKGFQYRSLPFLLEIINHNNFSSRKYRDISKYIFIKSMKKNAPDLYNLIKHLNIEYLNLLRDKLYIIRFQSTDIFDKMEDNLREAKEVIEWEDSVSKNIIIKNICVAKCRAETKSRRQFKEINRIFNSTKLSKDQQSLKDTYASLLAICTIEKSKITTVHEEEKVTSQENNMEYDLMGLKKEKNRLMKRLEKLDQGACEWLGITIEDLEKKASTEDDKNKLKTDITILSQAIKENN